MGLSIKLKVINRKKDTITDFYVGNCKVVSITYDESMDMYYVKFYSTADGYQITAETFYAFKNADRFCRAYCAETVAAMCTPYGGK